MHPMFRSVAGVFVSSFALMLVGCGGTSNSGGDQVTTLAGNSTFGIANGAGSTATFHNPVNVAVDSTGQVYIADYDNGAVRKITTSNIVSTLTLQSDFDKPFVG